MPQQMLRCMLTHVKVLRCIVDDNNKKQMPTYRACELDEKGHVVGPPAIILASNDTDDAGEALARWPRS